MSDTIRLTDSADVERFVTHGLLVVDGDGAGWALLTVEWTCDNPMCHLGHEMDPSSDDPASLGRCRNHCDHGGTVSRRVRVLDVLPIVDDYDSICSAYQGPAAIEVGEDTTRFWPEWSGAQEYEDGSDIDLGPDPKALVGRWLIRTGSRRSDASEKHPSGSGGSETCWR